MIAAFLDIPPAPFVADIWTQTLPPALIVAGAGLLLWAIWRRPRGGPAGQARSPMVAKQVETVMRDAEELAGLLAGQMERQAARLERLIAESDARIRQLERLNAGRAAPRDPAVDPLNQQVYELSDEGLPPVEIARQLNQQTGKVELILALRQR
jgi:hypothetical protein